MTVNQLLVLLFVGSKLLVVLVACIVWQALQPVECRDQRGAVSLTVHKPCGATVVQRKLVV